MNETLQRLNELASENAAAMLALQQTPFPQRTPSQIDQLRKHANRQRVIKKAIRAALYAVRISQDDNHV